MSIKMKLFLPYVLGILIICISIGTVSWFNLNREITHLMNDSRDKTYQNAREMLDQRKAIPEVSAKLLASSPELIQAIQKRDQTALRAIAKQFLSTSGISLLTISDEKGICLARGHSDKSGDNVLEQRNVQLALQGKIASGIEKGTVVKMAFRTGCPVRDGDKIIGVVTVGNDPFSNHKFVDEVKKAYGVECTIFEGENRFSTTILKENNRVVGTKLDNIAILKKVLAEGGEFFGENTILGKSYTTAYGPIYDLDNKVSGMIFIGLPTDFFANSAMLLVSSIFTTIVIVGGLLLLLTWFFLSKGISKVLNALIGEATRLSRAAVHGQLATRGDPMLVTKEFRPIVTGVNDTLDAVIGPLNVAADYVDRISKGDIPAKITDDYNGDFNTIKNNLNRCIDALDGLVNEMNHMSDEHNKGDIDVVIASDRFDGAYRDMAIGINGMVNGHIAVKKKAMACIAEFGKGNFDAPLEKFPGKKAFINDTIERVRANLKNVAVDAVTLAEAAAKGDLNVRADAQQYAGTWQQIIEGMNNMLDGFVVPVRDIAQTLQAMAKKDFTDPVSNEYPGTYGELRDNVNLVVNNIRSAVEQITESASQFTEGARVIAESSQTLASGAQTQSSSVEEMTASIEELARSVDSVKANAEEANRVAGEANTLAENGGKAVQKSIESMEMIRTSSQQISEIIQVIAEIASQTNLLALNAAIEAARAGEHGMGFAVVADEVRKLAERSNQAAREISTLIKESTQRVAEGGQLSNQTGEALKQIITAAEATAAKIAEIAASTVQQAANAQEVSKAIQNIAHVTEQSAAGSEEMASSSEELGAQASALRDLVTEFNVGATKTVSGVAHRN